MIAALFTTVFFSVSAITGHRCARVFGGVEANFYRLCLASLLLGLYVHIYGTMASGSAALAFAWSGIVGVGIGDLLFFQALPRLGSRLTVLLIQCLSVPFAAAVEWLWLGTTLSWAQAGWILVILSGLVLALWPPNGESLRARWRSQPGWRTGVMFGVLAAVGNGWGAVLSRKAYALARQHGEDVDGFSAAFQRVLGGLLVALVVVVVLRGRKIWTQIEAVGFAPSETYRAKWRQAWPWMVATGLAGQTLGVTCFQWALKHHPTAVVLPVVALTPLVSIPLTHFFERDRPDGKSLAGGIVAVIGVIQLLRVH